MYHVCVSLARSAECQYLKEYSIKNNMGIIGNAMRIK